MTPNEEKIACRLSHDLILRQHKQIQSRKENTLEHYFPWLRAHAVFYYIYVRSYIGVHARQRNKNNQTCRVSAVTSAAIPARRTVHALSCMDHIAPPMNPSAAASTSHGQGGMRSKNCNGWKTYGDCKRNFYSDCGVASLRRLTLQPGLSHRITKIACNLTALRHLRHHCLRLNHHICFAA